VILDTDSSEPLFFLIDTGSSVSMIQESSLRGHQQYIRNNLRVSAVTGDPIRIAGQLDVTLGTSTSEIGDHRFLIQSNNFPTFHGILGSDWLRENKVLIDYANEGLRLKNQGQWIPFQKYENMKSLQLNAVIEEVEDKKDETMDEYEVITTIYLNAAKPRKVPSLTTGNLEVKWRKNKIPYDAEEVVILVEPHARLKSDLDGLMIGRALLDGKESRSFVPYVNVTDQDLFVDKGDVLAKGTVLIRKPKVQSENLKSSNFEKAREEAENSSKGSKEVLIPKAEKTWTHVKPESHVSESDKGRENDSCENRQTRKRKARARFVDAENQDSTFTRQKSRKRESIFIGAINVIEGKDFDRAEDIVQLIEAAIKKSECPEKYQNDLRSLLTSYQDILAKKGDPVGLCEFYQPTINLDTTEPIYVPQYPIPHAMRSEVSKSINDFLAEGIIQYSKSPYNAPTLMVKKKDGGYRMVVDYRKLNMHIITDPFPLPRIQQILEDLGGCKYFTTFDLMNGFYNIKIHPKDRYKTGFSTHDGHYEFVRLPMGLKNSPSIFQRMMNAVLQGSLGKYAYIYIDDVVVYSKTAKEHLVHMEQVLRQLREANLRIKFSKCQFFQSHVEYLGYIIGRDGMRVNPKKLKAISHYPIPKDVKGVQAFLGLIGYFRLFVKGFASKARPLYDLLKKGIDFKWTLRHTNAFNQLKDALMHAPVLAFPDFKKEFILTTDASALALGAILTQETPKGEVLISCHSRTLKNAELNYSNTDRELSAVMYGVRQNRSYLWGHPFVIRTDHMAIPYLQRNMSDNYRAIRWHTELGEYTYRVEHRKGKSIAHADALSRYPHDQEINCYLSPSMQETEFIPIWDLEYWKKVIKKEPKLPDTTTDKYLQKDELIYHKIDNQNILWVPPKLRDEVIRAFHEPPSMGHQGVDKTYNVMKQHVYWNNMQKDIRESIQSCEICQKYKAFKHMTPSQRVPIPILPFEEVSMDIVGPVPSSRIGNRYILAIQDRLSRWIVFTPISDQSAETTIRAFLTKWICVYGVPKKVITDRGTNFVSELFKELHNFLGIRPSNTCAYRPQGNGQNERSHQTLHKYLAMYLQPANRSTWDTMLSVASWVHNSTPHRSLNVSPFEVITGLQPRQAQAWLPQEGEKARDLFRQYMNYYGVNRQTLKEIREKAREMIGKAQDDYLERVNRNTKELIYHVGDLVLIRVQDRSTYISRKWSAKYKGPYKVTAIIGPTVVKIKDMETGNEDLIHVVYLRPYRAKSPPPDDEQEPKRHYQQIEFELNQNPDVVDPEIYSEPESDVEQMPDLKEVTPFEATENTDDVLSDSEPKFDDIYNLPTDDSWPTTPEKSEGSTPKSKERTSKSSSTSKSTSQSERTDESFSPSLLEKTTTSEDSPEDPRKTMPKPSWRETIWQKTKAASKNVGRMLLGSDSESEDEDTHRQRRRRSSSQQKQTGARPKTRSTRAQSQTTPTTHLSEARGGKPSNLETEGEGEGRRQSSRLKTKTRPDYHEARLESQREIRTRQLKQKSATKK